MVPKVHLQIGRQRAKPSSTVLTDSHSFLLCFRLFGPRKGERGGEEEARPQAPICRILRAHRGCNGGRSNGLGAL